jgi:hypothetical protein
VVTVAKFHVLFTGSFHSKLLTDDVLQDGINEDLS